MSQTRTFVILRIHCRIPSIISSVRLTNRSQVFQHLNTRFECTIHFKKLLCINVDEPIVKSGWEVVGHMIKINVTLYDLSRSQNALNDSLVIVEYSPIIVSL
ncbi:hypothetical protein RF11_07065 [Thelohanellus kitauei]|uniref:Uncharacterized protein n=1 Tax=Thelohanellus kitauei TaxID=669202 RepID=A0A0C2IZD7_THEKT|nr:hypothetical protein RF11_07065 [Thelohanellus kitauei]